MAERIRGKRLIDAYSILKEAGYDVTAFFGNWFRAETESDAIEVEFDGLQYVVKASDC